MLSVITSYSIHYTKLYDGFGSVVLPALTLGTGLTAVLSRMVRSSMLEVLGEDYIRTARAKGLPPHRVILRHGLRNVV